MRAALLLTPLLAITPTVFGAAVNLPANHTSDDIIYEPSHHMLERAEGSGTNYGGMQGTNNGWQIWSVFPFFVPKDKFFMLRFPEANCQGKTIRKKGYNMQAGSEKHFAKDAMSMRYALPSDGHMSFVDITFWDRHIKDQHGHRCGGNIVYKLDGARGETMDGDRYPCHPIPQAKCISVGTIGGR